MGITTSIAQKQNTAPFAPAGHATESTTQQRTDEMRELAGSHILCEALIREGVDLLFGYPGGTIMPFYDALTSYPSLRHILVRHEQAAAHAADGYARATGKVGVCVATSGPGATNLVTGLATAFMDSTPIVAITGQVARVEETQKDGPAALPIHGRRRALQPEGVTARDAEDGHSTR